MRILILLLILVTGCAEMPLRGPASAPMRFGEVSAIHSSIQLFPDSDADTHTYYFYLQLKDSKGEFIDCDPSEIVLKTKKKKLIKFKYERLLTGRYYLILDKSQGFKDINFSVRGIALNGKFNLDIRRPDIKHTNIILERKLPGKLIFRLKLADRANRPVMTSVAPEIIMDGRGEIQELRYIQEGIWQFTVIYPEDNQIMYFSVRSQGKYLVNLLRYQHVEK